MDARVQVCSVSLVKPAKPTPRHILYMSGVDQVRKSAGPNRTVLFYNTDMNAAAAVDVLREGLASVLVAFYPVAGQLVLDDDGRLAIDCNDTGVELMEASCEGIRFADLQPHGFPVQPLFSRLVPMDRRSTSDHTAEPIASIQVTSFVGGGLAVGIAIAHSVVDGYGCWMFIKALSEACKEEPLSVSPLHARSLLNPATMLLNKTLSPPLVATAASQLSREDDKGSSKATAYTEPSMAISHKQRIETIPPEQLQQKFIHFSKNALQTLKEELCRSSTNKHPSTFDALSAYLWKRLTMAQELPDETPVAFRLPLDIRRRITPPLTLAFFGNALVAVTVITSAKELKEESLGATAVRIRREIQNGDDAYIKKVIADTREGLDLREIVAQSEELIFFIRNASHFPVYQASEFGWGEAERVRPPLGLREPKMTWYPSKEGDGIDVLMALSASTSALFFSPHLYANDPLLPYHHAIFEPDS